MLADTSWVHTKPLLYSVNSNKPCSSIFIYFFWSEFYLFLNILSRV